MQDESSHDDDQLSSVAHVSGDLELELVDFCLCSSWRLTRETFSVLSLFFILICLYTNYLV